MGRIKLGLYLNNAGHKGHLYLKLTVYLQAVRAPDEAKLPVSWLSGNTGEHATSLDVSN